MTYTLHNRLTSHINIECRFKIKWNYYYQLIISDAIYTK